MSGSSFRSHCGEIGRHEGLKIPFWRQSAGSSPAGGMERSELYGKTYDFWAFFFLRMDGQKINRTACGDIGGVSDIPRRRAVGGTLYLRTGNTLASDNGRKCNMDVSPKERREQDVQFIETALKRLIEQVSSALPNRHMRLKNFVQFS